MIPRYMNLLENGGLEARISLGRTQLARCTLCSRRCRVNRLAGERGYCGCCEFADVASYGPHFGEEACLVGEHGSGTIFFCGCNLRCSFCQNFAISRHLDAGCHRSRPDELAAIMLELQEMGCHNINLVTPTHLTVQILEALLIAARNGLRLSLVYNCGGYESLETLRLLDGVVDIYLPDIKFASPTTASFWTQAADYPLRARESVLEMQRQVGDLCFDDKGLAREGLMVRHLLMPDGLAEAEQIFDFLADKVSASCYLNIMDQYHPCGDACDIASAQETIAPLYYQQAMQLARKAGLHRLEEKDMEGVLKRLFL